MEESCSSSLGLSEYVFFTPQKKHFKVELVTINFHKPMDKIEATFKLSDFSFSSDNAITTSPRSHGVIQSWSFSFVVRAGLVGATMNPTNPILTL